MCLGRVVIMAAVLVLIGAGTLTGVASTIAALASSSRSGSASPPAADPRPRYQMEIGPYWANGSSGPASSGCTDAAARPPRLVAPGQFPASCPSVSPAT